LALTFSACDNTATETPTADVTDTSSGEALEDVLENWYGLYISETGAEIYISNSIIEKSISVSFNLYDEIGSMYSSGGIKVSIDDGSAADDYVMLSLDGDTLTVESLDEQFVDYAGRYERE
jgi:hypothetical protein